MKKVLLFIVIIFFLAATSLTACNQKPSAPSVTVPAIPSKSPPAPVPSPPAAPSSNPSATLTVQELKLKIENQESFVLVDVRSKADFDASHIEGAISIPLEEIPDRYGEIQKGIEVIVYAECA